jgi:hypothetical protein
LRLGRAGGHPTRGAWPRRTAPSTCAAGPRSRWRSSGPGSSTGTERPIGSVR